LASISVWLTAGDNPNLCDYSIQATLYTADSFVTRLLGYSRIALADNTKDPVEYLFDFQSQGLPIHFGGRYRVALRLVYGGLGASPEPVRASLLISIAPAYFEFSLSV